MSDVGAMSGVRGNVGEGVTVAALDSALGVVSGRVIHARTRRPLASTSTIKGQRKPFTIIFFSYKQNEVFCVAAKHPPQHR
jgi:hypothetical protein